LRIGITLALFEMPDPDLLMIIEEIFCTANWVSSSKLSERQKNVVPKAKRN
jgi:hypothetical protein